jgi:glyoxylase-like metal-dependent hydrolase (beta-lactamase superfamily II)
MGALLAVPAAGQHAHTRHQVDSAAVTMVRSALAAIGGNGAIERAGGLVLEGEGFADLGIRLQGMRPGSRERVPLVERLAVDATGTRIAYESRTHVNPDAEEWLRYAFEGDDLLIMDRLEERAFRDAGGGTPEERRRYARAIPHLLLEAALRDSAALATSGATAVRYAVNDVKTLTLQFDAQSRRLQSFEYLLDMPLTGDTPVLWTYGRYRDVKGLGMYPEGYTIALADQVLRDVRYRTVSPGAAGAALLDIPDGLTIPPPRTAPAASADSATTPPPAVPRAAVRTLAPGVYLVPNVRPGFHVLFTEFDEFVLVVDAPAGWHELHQVPAVDLVPGASSSAVGARLLEIVRTTVPDKPVRYVALTHHHSDHAGGVRPFVAAGATILGSAPTRQVVEQAVRAPYTLGPDALSQRRVPLSFETVGAEHIVRDDSMEVRLIDVGPNPHAEGMLVAWLPRQKILYVADLFEPRSTPGFPSKARLPVMRWFVDWLDRSGLDPQTIYAIHGSARVTDEQLDLIRGLPAAP